MIKRLFIPILFLLSLGCGWMSAQVSQPPGVILVTAGPSGACTAGAAGQLVASTGTLYTCQSGTWALVGGGGAGATFPTSPVSALFTYTSDVAGRAAIGQDVATAAKSINSTSFFMTDTPPSAPSVDNVAIGVGVAPSLANGSGSGGQANVYIGFNAGHAATTQRESVVIGNQAGLNITGNNTGPDDMIFVLIGSLAGAGLTNLGGGSVIIGQKAAEDATSSGADVIIGVHAGTAISTSQNDTIIGGLTWQGLGPHSGTNNLFIGSSAGVSVASGSVENDNVALGYNALPNLGTADGNIAIGSGIGTNVTTGNNNVLIGTNAASGNPFTGTFNVVIGSGAGNNITSGSGNFVLQSAGPSTGSSNFMMGINTGNNIRAGSDNIFVGSSTARFTGDISNSIIFGTNAGQSVTTGNQVIIGYQAGQSLTSGTNNTLLGYQAGRIFNTGSNNTGLGFSTISSLSGAESNNTAVGASADIATGTSGAGEFGPGQCAAGNNAFCFKGVPIAGTTQFSVSGCGTVTQLAGQATAGAFIGASATCNPIITMGLTAPNAFSCFMYDVTTPAATFRVTTRSATSVTFASTGAVISGDTIDFGCNAW